MSNLMEFCEHLLKLYLIRGPAATVKPRDAFVQTKWRGWGEPLKDASSHMCYHTEFGISSTSTGVGINRGNPQNWGALGLAELRCGAWLTPRETPLPHMCYRAQFGHSRSNGMGIVRGGGVVKRFFRTLGPVPWDEGMADPTGVATITHGTRVRTDLFSN